MRGVILSLVLLTVTAVAAPPVPPLITYQGRLLDSTGAPVADGNYHITFRLYDSATGGTLLWDSGPQSVPVSDGLFTYTLGSAVPLPDGLFAENLTWLGITVPPDPEMVPRVQLTSSAYTKSAAYSHSAGSAQYAQNANRLGNQLPSYYLNWNNLTSVPAGFADGTDDTGMDSAFIESTFARSAVVESNFLHKHGDTTKGDLFFDPNGDGIADGSLTGNGYLNLVLNSGVRRASILWGDHYGTLELFSSNAIRTATIDATSWGGGIIKLANVTGATTISLDGDLEGDGSVQLPNDAIASNEVLDEPGIATSWLGWAALDTVDVNLDSVTIVAPGPGYVVVRVTGTISVLENGHGGIARIGINKQSALIVQRTDFEWSSSGPHSESFATSYVDAIAGGPRKYYLVARLDDDPLTVSWANVIDAQLIATYYPTAYGPVVANPAPPRPDRQHSSAAGGANTVTALTDYRPLVERWQAERVRKLEERVQKLEEALSRGHKQRH